MDLGGGAEAKIQLFQNIVVLHIKLIGMKGQVVRANCLLPDQESGQSFKGKLFAIMFCTHHSLELEINPTTFRKKNSYHGLRVCV